MWKKLVPLDCLQDKGQHVVPTFLCDHVQQGGGQKLFWNVLDDFPFKLLIKNDTRFFSD